MELKKKAEAEAHLMELRAKLQAVIGDVDIGENCGTQAFKDYLYKVERLPVLKTTTKYAEAADDEAIQLLRAYCKKHRPELVAFFETVQEFREWAKIKSTYIDGYMKWINPATGRNGICPAGAERKFTQDRIFQSRFPSFSIPKAFAGMANSQTHWSLAIRLTTFISWVTHFRTGRP
jgi:hypothetical protein